MRRRHLTVLAVLALAIAGIAAGCGGSKKDAAATTVAVSDTGTTTTAATDLLPGQTKPSIYNDASLFVLHEDDVPVDYTVDVQNTRGVTNADTAKGRGDAYLRQIKSWGRITGYGAGWLPSESAVQKEPLQIQSSASTFETVGGASDAFAQGVKETAKLKVKPTEMSETVGDESRMWIATIDTASNGTLTIYEMAWRSGRILATLAVATKGSVKADAAIEFAKKQQARIERIVATEPDSSK